MSENGLIEMFEKEGEDIDVTFGGEFTAATASQDGIVPQIPKTDGDEQPLMTQIAETPQGNSQT